MKFRTTVEEFKKQSALPLAVAQRKSTIPILSSILLDTETMTVTGTDLDTSAVKKITSKGKVGSPGKICIPGYELKKWLSAMKEGALLIESKPKLPSPPVTLTCGDSSITFDTFATDNFPVLPATPTEAVQALPEKSLCNALFAVEAFSCNVMSRYMLGAALLKFNHDVLIVAATDGHRLAECTIKPVVTEKIRDVLVANNSIRHLAEFCKSTEGVSLAVSKDSLFFSSGVERLCVRQKEGTFPNYGVMLGKPIGNCVVTASSKELLKLIRQAAISADERSGCLYLTIGKDFFYISGQSANRRANKVPCTISGVPMSVGVNATYFGDCIRSADSESVAISFTAPDAFILIEPKVQDESMRRRSLVMPMRI